MARRKTALFSGNLDALMDTLTNVVGILIIVLILVQLGLSQSLKKIISDLPPASPEEVQQLRDDTADQLVKYEKFHELIENQRARVAGDRDELAKLNPQLTTLETSAELSAIPILDMASIQNKNLDNGSVLDRLRKETAELLAEQQRLKALLDTTPVAPLPPDKIVRIPNSRALPENAKMERYLVAGNQLYGYDPEGAKKLLLQEFQNARTRLEKEKTKAPDGSAEIIYDQDKTVKFFEQRKLTLRGLELRVPYNQTGTRLNLELVPGIGEAIETAAQFNSRFQNDLRRFKSSNTVVWFHVTRGAFDAYLRARDLCDAVGVSAGWELTNDATHTEPITEFAVNRMVEPAPPPPPPVTPVATPVPRATPPPPPLQIKIDPPKKRLD
jgi:hypothetical protein